MAAAVAMNPAEKLRQMTPLAAPPEQAADIRALLMVLRAQNAGAPRCRLVGPHNENIAIPDSVFHVLARVAEVLARGDAITVVPVGKELTTQQGADLLNVSRQYLVRLLDEGRIPFTKTGKHRRIRMDDLLAFKAERDRERNSALSELTALSEELGGYEEVR